jgi:hypothetical protein
MDRGEVAMGRGLNRWAEMGEETSRSESMRKPDNARRPVRSDGPPIPELA